MPNEQDGPGLEAEQVHEARRVLSKWHFRARDVQIASYNAAKWFRFWHFMFGAPLIVITAITGTEEYRTESISRHSFYGVSTEIIGITVPLIIALQTFLSYNQRAEKFQTAGSQYSSIRRKIEQGAVFHMATSQSAQAFMESIRPTLDTLATEAPDPPFIVWKWTKFWLKNDTHNPLFSK